MRVTDMGDKILGIKEEGKKGLLKKKISILARERESAASDEQHN